MLKNIKVLNVFIHGKKAGRLGEADSGVYVFEYDQIFLKTGFSLSPFYLPLKPGVFTAKQEPFSGMFGVFADSLPDGWGRLLIDRLLLKYRINPAEVTQAERLSIVGKNGMGALEYHPENGFFHGSKKAGIKELALEVKKVLDEDYSGHLETLAKNGGSSGGARPKAIVDFKGESWLVKFPNSSDRKNAGAIEYAYSLAAKKCGIDMPDTRLFEGKYYGIKRFDRNKKKKIHMHSAAGLLNADFRLPSLDYTMLLKAAMKLTGNMQEVEKLFRLMVFNIESRNRDDHAKNFSYLYKSGKWQVSPAYDLTNSPGFNGQHTTTLLGSGTPGSKDIMETAKLMGIKDKTANRIMEETKEAINPLKKHFK